MPRASQVAKGQTRKYVHGLDFPLPGYVPAEKEKFTNLLNENFGSGPSIEGSVVKGLVVDITHDFVMVDVGMKAEGRVPRREFGAGDDATTVQIGDLVDVYVDKIEGKEGEAVLSRERARREEIWVELEEAHITGKHVMGTIFSKVKGGFTVDLNGAIAFLPGSQLDIRPLKDTNPLMNVAQPFVLLKMDRARGNIVVSRRAVLEETRADARAELISDLREGQQLTGTVKNITDYGAFIDLGGVDGLLHMTDISWQRLNHPSDALTIGQQVEVVVIRFNRESQRISLGMKQLQADPWEGKDDQLQVGQKIKGEVTGVTDLGAYVTFGDGMEGMIHVAEMTWNRKLQNDPAKFVQEGQTIEAQILEVDREKRRISLGLKQLSDNPWVEFAKTHPAGSDYTGELVNITELGMFIALPGGVDGMININDLSWDQTGEEAVKAYAKGAQVTARVLDVDTDRERVALGIKQLTGEDPAMTAINSLKKSDVVTGTVTAVRDDNIEVLVNDKIYGIIKRAELSRDRAEQRTNRFAVGDKVDAKIIAVMKSAKRIELSIKAHEFAEEKAAIAEFGSSESGASLGSILGAALRKAQTTNQDSETAETDEE